MELKPPLPVAELAAYLNAELLGPPSLMVQGVNEFHCLQAGDLAFVDHPKYYRRVLDSPAVAILINQAVEPPNGKALLVVAEPFTAFNQVLDWQFPQPDPLATGTPTLGPGARLAPGVHCGPGVTIGAHTVVGPGVALGAGTRVGNHCQLGPGVVVGPGVTLGNHVTVHAGAVLGANAFYYKTRPQGREALRTVGTLVVEDHVEIGANCTLDRGTTGTTRIGAHTKLDNLVQIGHDTQVGAHCLLAAQVGVAGACTLEDGVTLWGQVGVSSGLRLGAGAVVYAQSGVKDSLPGGQAYFGSPAREARAAFKAWAAVQRLADGGGVGY